MGVLVDPTISTPVLIPQLQRALTSQRETARATAPQRLAATLPITDALRVAASSWDRFSTTLISSWPSSSLQIPNRCWAEMCAQYSSGLVGTRILGTDVVLDALGKVLLTQANLVNRGGGGARTAWHDGLLECALCIVKEAGISALSEVFGIFSDVVAPTIRTRLYGRYRGNLARRQVVQDILTTLDNKEQLYDLKTLAWGSIYTAHALHPSHPSPVDRRAAQVHSEYLAHARGIDAIIPQPGTAPPPGFLGPVEQRLRSFGTVAGLVFGAFGEASAACHALVQTCAERIAARTWVASGCANFTKAKAAQIRRIYCEWGIANALGRARYPSPPSPMSPPRGAPPRPPDPSRPSPFVAHTSGGSMRTTYGRGPSYLRLPQDSAMTPTRSRILIYARQAHPSCPTKPPTSFMHHTHTPLLAVDL